MGGAGIRREHVGLKRLMRATIKDIFILRVKNENSCFCMDYFAGVLAYD